MHSGRLVTLEVPVEGEAGTLDQQVLVAGSKFPLDDRSVRRCAAHEVQGSMTISQSGTLLLHETSPRKPWSVESNSGCPSTHDCFRCYDAYTSLFILFIYSFSLLFFFYFMCHQLDSKRKSDFKYTRYQACGRYKSFTYNFTILWEKNISLPFHSLLSCILLFVCKIFILIRKFFKSVSMVGILVNN